MARVPTVTTVDQQPAGTIPGGFRERSEAAPFDFGQSAARAMEAAGQQGAALANLGSQLQRTGGVLTQQAVRDQEVQNETQATEAVTALSQSLNEEWARFSELQGRAATEAFPGFQERVRGAAQAALESAANPRVRQMLAGRVNAMAQGMLGSAAQWNTRQTRAASVQSSEAAANQSIADGMLNRTNPEGLARAMAAGMSEITKIGEINGWDRITLDQRQAEFRGRFYSTVIASVVETDPMAAQRMFTAVRGQLDAASQVRIENLLSAPVTQADAAARVARAVQPSMQPDSPAGVRARVFQAENPAGDARRNPNSTASGPGQITDETWAAYAARLGLRPDQRNDRTAHEAIFDAYQADARRIIGRDLTAGEQYAAWFLGVGAAKAFIEAAPGTDARVLYAQVAGERRAEQAFRTNGNLLRPGMTTGQVLEAVAARVGSAPRQDSGALLRSALEGTENNPRLQAAVLSQFNMWQNVLNATQAQERASLERRVQDIGRALQQGASVSIPEAEIRRLYQPEQADRVLDTLYTAQVAGQVLQSVQLAPPQELQALRDDLANGSGPVSELLRLRRGTRLGPDGQVLEEDRAGDVAARGDLRNVLERRIEDRNRQLFQDPAQFVLADPTVRSAAQRAASGDDAQAMQDYVTATLASQARLGVPEQNRRVLSIAQSQAIAADLLRADPGQGTAQNPDTPALRLRSLARTYGDAWPRVFQDVVRDGRLSPEFQVLAVITSAVGQADYARMLAAARQAGGVDKLRQTGDQVVQRQINDGVAAFVAPFVRTATASGQSGGPPLAAMVEDAVRDLATYYRLQGADANAALQRATDRIINDKYEIQGTMRVPRTLDDGRPLGLAPVQRAQAEVMRGLTPESLADIGGNPQVPPDERRRIAHRAAQRGFWVPNERDNGLVLMMELENGGRLPVRRQGGERVELFFDRLPEPVVQGISRTRPEDFGLDTIGRHMSTGPGALPQRQRTGPIEPPNPANRAPPPNPANRAPPPPVREVLPGEPRGRQGTQPRNGQWVPPQ